MTLLEQAGTVGKALLLEMWMTSPIKMGRLRKAEDCSASLKQMRGFFKLEENLKSRLLSGCANSDLSRVNPPNFIKELQKAENGSALLKQMRGFVCVVCFKGCTVVNNHGTY